MAVTFPTLRPPQLTALNPHSELIFNSVFPNGTLRPPQNYVRFQTSAEASKSAYKALLIQDARTMLGVGDECMFSLGGSTHVDESFWTGFERCPPMAAVIGRVVTGPGSSVKAKAKMRRKEKVLHDRFIALGSVREVKSWKEMLGANELKKVFAHVVDQLLTEFVQWSYGGVYGDEVRQHLQYWTEIVLVWYIKTYIGTVDHGSIYVLPSTALEDEDGNDASTAKYHDMCLTRLATLRTRDLFDIIIEYPDTASGIDDLKAYVTSPATRSYVTTNFVNALQVRLLHPGASTVEILRVYVAIIRAFRRLDNRGVLLERVARRLRRYLRERDDTVKVIVAGLLSDSVDDVMDDGEARQDDNPDVLTELAWELQHRESNKSATRNVSSLDWDNMEWLPDPVDATPDYLKSSSTSTDVISNMISLFESKDTVVKELQQTLAERLLRNRTGYDQEIAVVEHLKLQFGDAKLQDCEVMLRDVLDSRRVDSVVRRDMGLDVKSDDEEDQPQLHAKILSRIFWPSLPDPYFEAAAEASYEAEEYTAPKGINIPFPILEQRARYEKGFETLKANRKLTWNDSIGSVTVDLSFEDGREISCEVLPGQASVIYAFMDESDEPAEPNATTRTVTSLAAQLNISPTLVHSACMFWVSLQVLVTHTSQKDAFTVLEHLDPTSSNTTSTPSHPSTATTAATAAAAAAAAASAATAQAARDARKTQMAVYNEFVISMLTNAGMPMAVPQMHMMLGMVVPGGFPWSVAELRGEVVAVLEKAGRVKEVGGGRFTIA